MAALDLLGRRWALRLLWELRDGPVGARALRERCGGMSSSVLYQRLGELGSAGLVVQTEHGAYSLTSLGRDLGTALAPLEQWSQRWAASDGSRDTDGSQGGGETDVGDEPGGPDDGT